MAHGAVEDAQLGHTLREQSLRRQARHLTGADHERALARERIEDPLGQLDGGMHHRHRGPTDGGLGAHALGDGEGPPHRAVERVPRGPGARGLVEGLLELPQDLWLAHDHRIEACGNAKEMAKRSLAAALVQVWQHRWLLRQQLAKAISDLACVPAGAVQLDAVAGREHHALAHTGHSTQALERESRVRGEVRDPLAHGDRRGLVRDAEQHQVVAHGSPNPARPRGEVSQRPRGRTVRERPNAATLAACRDLDPP